MIGHGLDLAAVAAAENNTRHRHVSALFQGHKNIRLLPGSGYAKKHVLGACPAGQLSSKDCLVTIVVADGGKDRAIDCQRFGGQCGSFPSQFADEFSGEMLSVGRRASVSGNIEPSALLITVDNRRHGLLEKPQTRVIRQQLLLGLDGQCQIFLEIFDRFEGSALSIALAERKRGSNHRVHQCR